MPHRKHAVCSSGVFGWSIIPYTRSFWGKYSKITFSLLYLAQMRAFPVIAAVGLVALSMYVRVYRRMARNFRSLAKYTVFRLGGYPNCVAYAVIDYRISRIGRPDKVVDFSCTVVCRRCTSEEFYQIRSSVDLAFSDYMEYERTETVVRNYFVNITGARVTSGGAETVPFSQLMIRVAGEYVKPSDLFNSDVRVHSVLMDMPRGAIDDAIREVFEENASWMIVPAGKKDEGE